MSWAEHDRRQGRGTPRSGRVIGMTRTPERAKRATDSTGRMPEPDEGGQRHEQGRPIGIDPQGAPAIELVGLEKRFGSVHAVRGIDLTVEQGEIVAFLGPNGAGKTTTIDMMLGLSTPTAGVARVFGMEPRAAIGRGLVAAVMQTGGLLKDLTVRETVDLTASLF